MPDIDFKERSEANRKRAAHDPYCTLDRCVCPTCATTQVLLRSMLQTSRNVRDFDAKRVTIRATDFAGGHAYLASVRVDGREVFRIERRPDEVFRTDALDDIVKALRRPM